MKFSIIEVSSGLLMLAAAAVMLAQAAGYNGVPGNYNQGNGARGNLNTVGRYQCQGYNCNNNTNKLPFGPYHTYAVRPKPAHYGGRGLYYYRGYARQPAGVKPYRSRNQQRYNNRGCYGPNCNANKYHRNHKQTARPQSYRAPTANNLHGFRPVKVLMLTPQSKANYQAENSNSNRLKGLQTPLKAGKSNVYNNSANYNNRNNGAPLRSAGAY